MDDQRPMNTYGDNPPAYSEIMPSNNQPNQHGDGESSWAGIATSTTAVPTHTFYPPPQHAEYVGDIGTMTTETPTHHTHTHAQQQPKQQQQYVTTQPILQPQNMSLNYGTMDSGRAPIQATIYAVPPQPPLPQNITHHHIIVDDIRLVGGCPICRIGMLEDNFPCAAVCCAIIFFPIGVLFCLAMRNKRCSHCSYEF